MHIFYNIIYFLIIKLFYNININLLNMFSQDQQNKIKTFSTVAKISNICFSNCINFENLNKSNNIINNSDMNNQLNNFENSVISNNIYL